MKEEPIGQLFKKITVEIKKYFENELMDSDITMSQGMVLAYLANHPDGSVSQRDLERHFGLRHPTVSGILKRLEQSGYVTFITKNDDHRVKLIRPTAKADKLHDNVELSHKKLDERLFSGFSEEEKIILRSLLERVLSNISEEKSDIKEKQEDK